MPEKDGGGGGGLGQFADLREWFGKKEEGGVFEGVVTPIYTMAICTLLLLKANCVLCSSIWDLVLRKYSYIYTQFYHGIL